MSRRNLRQEWRTFRRVLNITLVLVWGITFFFTLVIPNDVYGKIVFGQSREFIAPYVTHQTGYRSVSYRADILYTTTGVFSAGNPVDVKIIIDNVNVTDLTKDYNAVSFTGAFFDQPLLLDSKDGGKTYTATGRFMRMEEGYSRLFLYHYVPNFGINVKTPNETQKIGLSDALYSSTHSDTLTLQFNEFAVKLSFVLGSFSVLLFQPIIEAILLPSEEEHEDKTNDNHGKPDASKPKQTKKTKEQGDLNPYKI